MKTKSNVAGGHFLYAGTESTDIFTPEDFTDEHKMIAQTAKQFIEKEVDPHKEQIEAQNIDLIVSLLRKGGDLGLLAHSIPEEYGGLGLDKISKGLVGEVIGRTSGYGVAHSNHTCIATLPITYFGTPEQKKTYLPKLASGEYLGAYCLTEPSAGSDALAAKTTAVLNEEGTHYVLNGTKIYITNAVFSDTFIVYGKVDGKHFTAFIVEKNFPGLSLGPEEKKMGIKGSSTRSVILEDCLVPVENVLGEIGKGHHIALNVLNLGRFNLGSACMGASKYALETALKFTTERQQFGQSIADFAATKEKVAKMATRIYAAESLQYRTAGLLEGVLGDLYTSDDQKQVAKALSEYAIECSVCKVYGSETLDYVVDEALQLHGGAGFINEYPVEQMYRDSRINRIFEGTNEINRLLLPTHLFRKVQKGELQLESVIQEAFNHLREEAANDSEMPMKDKVALLRDVFLICAGLAHQTLGERLVQEQEVLMNLSNMAIALYATESAWLRTDKAPSSELKTYLATALMEQTIVEVDGLSRRLVNDLAKGKDKKELLRLFRETIGKVELQDMITVNRNIAAAQYEANHYTC
ncbi:acyl-CoA dehydrogenase family protein [Priestia koreensis]|uniref:acyl-CoA dehydrogenase family protein n=1 Tax=Priestia koreensis TaxID=284581 RepID=UPI0028F70798|nr:acyl-CoA dehydrogenase family protein [Priestia koreensis]